jgi:hypothetical protein
MKNQHLLALGAYALAFTLLPAAASAEGPPPDKGPEMKHGKPAGKPSELFGKPDDAKPEKGPHGDKDEKREPGKPGAEDGKPGGHEGFRSAMRQLREDLKAGKVKKGDLKDKLAKMHESSSDRGKEHRQELAKRWGNALALPSAREELKHHARRMAFLDRALVLAETEAKDKDKLTDRISKLIDKENERHERAMERLKSMPTPPGASAAAPAASAPPAAAPPAAAGSAEGAAK